MLALARSCGVALPALVTPEHIEVITERYRHAPLVDVFDYDPSWPVLSDARRDEIERLVAPPETAPPSV